MIKFGVDLKGEMFIYEASDEIVEGTEASCKVVVDALMEDFGITSEGIWRFHLLKLAPGLYTGTIKVVGYFEDGDFDIVLEDIISLTAVEDKDSLDSIEDIENCNSIEILMDEVNALASNQVHGTNACMERMDEIIDQNINPEENEEYFELGDGDSIIQEHFNHP